MKVKQIYKTFDQWKIDGRYVMKGQKSLRKNSKGIALFSKKQTLSSNDGKYNTPNGRPFTKNDSEYYEGYEETDWSNGLTAFDIGADF